jgi:hypothetical protein
MVINLCEEQCETSIPDILLHKKVNYIRVKIIPCLTQIIVILLLQNVSAQRSFNKPTRTFSRWEIGLSGGVSSFVTSVNPSSGTMSGQINYWTRDLNPGIGLSVVRNISPAFGIEIDWLNTRLTGTWNNRYPPLAISVGRESPLTFNSGINQFDLMAAFNINQIILRGKKEDRWHLFLKTGIGSTYIRDIKKVNGDLNTNTRISFVIDAGLSVLTTEKIKLMLGTSFRSVNTDILDVVMVTTNDLNGKIVNYMKVYEIYNYTYLRVSYNLGKPGSKKSRGTSRNKRGKCPIYQRN